MEERSFPTWSWQTKLVVSLLLLVGLLLVWVVAPFALATVVFRKRGVL